MQMAHADIRFDYAKGTATVHVLTTPDAEGLVAAYRSVFELEGTTIDPAVATDHTLFHGTKCSAYQAARVFGELAQPYRR